MLMDHQELLGTFGLGSASFGPGSLLDRTESAGLTESWVEPGNRKIGSHNCPLNHHVKPLGTPERDGSSAWLDLND